MPLPSLRLHGAKQCRAKAKSTGSQCQNPAAHGCATCRVHGARKLASIKRGDQHWNYKHGWDTQEATKRRQQAIKRLKVLHGLFRKVESL